MYDVDRCSGRPKVVALGREMGCCDGQIHSNLLTYHHQIYLKSVESKRNVNSRLLRLHNSSSHNWLCIKSMALGVGFGNYPLVLISMKSSFKSLWLSIHSLIYPLICSIVSRTNIIKIKMYRDRSKIISFLFYIYFGIL